MAKYSFLYKKAELMYENENYEYALQLFRQIEDADIDCDVQNYIGCCLLNLEQYLQAKKVFETLCDLNPRWSRPRYNLGRTFMMLNEYDKALQCFNKAVLINPEDADAYYYLGVYFEKINNYKNAITNYEKSVSLKPDEFEPHIGLCICYENIGDEQQALIEAKTAFELFNCNNTLYNYTYFLNKQKKFELSFDLLQEHNVLSGDDTGLLKNLMYCSEKLNKKQICSDCAKKISEQYPDDSFAKKIIAEFCSD